MRIAWMRILLAAAAVMAGFFAGCDKKEQASHTPPPGQAPAVRAPAEVPQPATKPTTTADADAPNSYLFIKKVPAPTPSGQAQPDAAEENPDDFGPSIQFARARLTFTGKGGQHLVVKLYSDDPKEALKDNWNGNRYIFSMPLEITERSQIDGRPYRMYVAPDSTEDTRFGIFLHGDDEHLEPIDLDVRFEVQGAKVVIAIGGLFKQLDPIKGDVQWYHVRGVLRANME